MAIALTTSSSLFISKHSPSSPRTTPFLGCSLSASTKPSLQSKRLFYICCQDKSSAIPPEQQWMFDDLTGPDVWNKTWYPKAKDHIPTSKTWYIVDASDKILGRLASTIAIHIRGKNLATYTPSVDMGAHVIVVTSYFFLSRITLIRYGWLLHNPTVLTTASPRGLLPG